MSTTLAMKPRVITAQYGIIEKKKSELDALSVEVLDAQYDVDQFQAIVSSLTDKLNKFNGFLAEADTERSFTLNNWNLINQLLQNTIDLERNSFLTSSEMDNTNQKMGLVSDKINEVINKLIYSAEVINKLANLVVRKKASNPLISDELVSRISKAGNDANNAVALTLIALKSTFAAQASNMESKSASDLEKKQSLFFYKLLTGSDKVAENVQPLAHAQMMAGTSLWHLLYQANERAKNNYDLIQKACVIVTGQLNNAQSQLNKAQIELRSLQLGLAAGTAAALAS